MTSKQAADISVMTPEQAAAAKVQIAEHIKAIRALLPGLVQFTQDERTHSEGRLRVGEDVALTAVLNSVDQVPAAFASLADRDDGLDSDLFETSLLRRRLATRRELAEVAQWTEQLATDLSDALLHLGELVRPVTLQAYGIARTLAKTDAKVRDALVPATDFFSDMTRAARRKRKAST